MKNRFWRYLLRSAFLAFMCCVPVRSLAAAKDFFVTDDWNSWACENVTSPSVVALPGQAVRLIGCSAANEVHLPTFQWFFQNSMVSGAISNSLLLPRVTSADAGRYTLRVTTDGTSQDISTRLIVSSAARISQTWEQPGVRSSYWSETAFIRAQVIQDSSRNLYLLSSRFLLEDYGPAAVLTKLSESGQMIWETTYNGPVGGAWAGGLALSRDGSPVVAVSSAYVPDGLEATNFGVVTLKFRPNGDLVWSNRLTLSPNSQGVAHGIIADSEDNVIVVGEVSPGDPRESGIVVVKYSSEGAELWRDFRTVSPSLLGTDLRRGLAADANGVFLASAAGVIKWDNNGHQLWYRKDPCSALALSAHGEVTAAFYNGTVRLGSNGAELWRSDVIGEVIGNLPDGGLLVGRLGLTKLDGLGRTVWTTHWNTTTCWPESLLEVFANADGSSFVLGVLAGERRSRMFVCKVASNGVTLWTTRWGFPANASFTPTSWAINGSNEVWITGTSGLDPIEQESISQYQVLKISPGSETNLPVFSTLPSSISVPYGGQATFHAMASGEASVQTTWGSYFRTLSADSGQSFRIDSVRFEDAGDYWVKLANDHGVVSSPLANLRVLGSGLSAAMVYDPSRWKVLPEIRAYGEPSLVYELQESNDFKDWRTITTYTNSLAQAWPFTLRVSDLLAQSKFYRMRRKL
jgi:hypothetical protein